MDQDPPNEASAKSLRFVKGIHRACHNPLCRSDFMAKRKDQRFCCRRCKESFFKVKYGLLTLAPYFNLDLGVRKGGLEIRPINDQKHGILDCAERGHSENDEVD